MATTEEQLVAEYGESGTFRGEEINQRTYEIYVAQLEAAQTSYREAVAEAADDQRILEGYRLRSKDFFWTYREPRFWPEPTEAERRRVERIAATVWFFTNDLPALLAPAAAVRMARRPSRASQKLSREIEKGLDQARAQGVRGFWKMERERLSSGQPGTRTWTRQQRQDIMDGKVPVDPVTGKPIEGHHLFSVKAYPEKAADPNNIYPLNRGEHQDAHGGDFRNDTHGTLPPGVPRTP